MANKGWSKRFDEPIVLDDDTTLTTLREAIEYLGKTVPKAEHDHPKVQNAADHLTRSAEQNYPMFFARAATLQTIHRHREPVFNPAKTITGKSEASRETSDSLDLRRYQQGRRQS